MSGLPAAAASVGNQSRPEKSPFSTDLGLILPGQRIMSWNAEAAFINGAFRGPERRHPAVWPGEHFGPIVCGEDDDGIVSLAHILDMLQQLADAVVHLRHAGFFETVIVLRI